MQSVSFNRPALSGVSRAGGLRATAGATALPLPPPLTSPFASRLLRRRCRCRRRSRRRPGRRRHRLCLTLGVLHSSGSGRTLALGQGQLKSAPAQVLNESLTCSVHNHKHHKLEIETQRMTDDSNQMAQIHHDQPSLIPLASQCCGAWVSGWVRGIRVIGRSGGGTKGTGASGPRSSRPAASAAWWYRYKSHGPSPTGGGGNDDQS